ncbi:MAG: TlpA family protein disulfide reductase [Thermoanaerobaculia bacterium]
MAVLEPGSSFPAISLRDAAGRPAVIPDGQTLWAFFKTTCPTCELMWPYLDRLAECSNGDGRVIAVSQDDVAETESFNERLGFRIRTLYDGPPWKASEALGLTNVPTLLLVDREGRIRETVEGFQKAKMEELAERFTDRRASGEPAESFFRAGESVPALRPG